MKVEQDLQLLREQLTARGAYEQFEYVEVTFDAARTDLVVPHTLKAPSPNQVSYRVVRANGPAVIYHDENQGRKEWGENFIVLRSSLAGVTVQLLLTVAAEGLPFRTHTVPSTSGMIPWGDVSKVGSSLSDLATRAVANLSDGANVALLNAANAFTAVQSVTHNTATSWGTNEGDWAIRIVDGTNDVGLLLAVGNEMDAAAIQSMDPGTSWITRPLVLQPNGGKVGIGGTPSYLLHLVDATAPEICLERTGATSSKFKFTPGYATEGDLGIYDVKDSALRQIFRTDGSVAILNPLCVGHNNAAAAQLHVEGGEVRIKNGDATQTHFNYGQTSVNYIRGLLNVSTHIYPEADNVANCGNATYRWALVRGVTITSGDLEFENKWVLTEHYNVGITEPGIAVLDENDQLRYFLGKTGWYGPAYKGGIGLLIHGVTPREIRRQKKN